MIAVYYENCMKSVNILCVKIVLIFLISIK